MRTYFKTTPRLVDIYKSVRVIEDGRQKKYVSVPSEGLESGFLPVEMEFHHLQREAAAYPSNLLPKIERFTGWYQRIAKRLGGESRCLQPFFKNYLSYIEQEVQQSHLPAIYKILDKILRDYPGFDIAFILRGTEGLYVAIRTYLLVRQIQGIRLYPLRISTPLFESTSPKMIEAYCLQEYCLQGGYQHRDLPILCVDTFYLGRILEVVPADAKLLYKYKSPTNAPKPRWLDTVWEEPTTPPCSLAELTRLPEDKLVLLETGPRNIPKTSKLVNCNGRLIPDYDLPTIEDDFLSRLRNYWWEVLCAWGYQMSIIKGMQASLK